MTTVIDLPNEDIAVEVARFFCKLLSLTTSKDETTVFYNTLTPSIPNHLATLVETLLANHSRIFAETNPTDVESCFNVLFTLIQRLDEEQDNRIEVEDTRPKGKKKGDAKHKAPPPEPKVVEPKSKLTTAFVKAIASDSARPELRLKIITNAFNLIHQSNPIRVQVLQTIVDFASSNSLHTSLSSSFAQAKLWAQLCGASPAQTRALLRSIFDSIVSSSTHNAVNLEVITSYLALYQGETDFSSVKEAATFAVIEAIRLPDVFRFESLYQLDAVKSLEKQNRQLFELFTIFSVHRLNDLTTFDNQNSGFIAGLGLDRSSVFDKMKLLTLASLASEQSQISYDNVASGLDVPVAEVEVWVIRALNAKLITAKLNQLSKVVIISGCVRRHQEVQWKEIQGKVAQWKENMQQLLVVMQTARANKERRQ
eukprot:c9147_g1_i1.p1 GENE.c9147_g1_i1~~c9147_g1_i1.p1  ORF type:complete len:425 (-),score=99.02 c9147_g1_i1:155-1429(-)